MFLRGSFHPEIASDPILTSNHFFGSSLLATFTNLNIASKSHLVIAQSTLTLIV